MASRFLIASPTSATTSWSATSGGASVGAVPTTADDVHLDANSPSATIDAALACLSFDCTGYTHTLTHNSPNIITVSGTVFKLVAGMTYTINGAGAAITLSATSGTLTFTSAGKQCGNITCGTSTTATTTWTFADSISIGTAATLTLLAGTLDLSGAATHSIGLFNAVNANVKTVTITGSSITCTGSGNAWTLGSGISNTTFNASGSTITISASNATFAPGQFNTTTAIGTYNNVVMSGAGTQVVSLPGNIAPTITSLTRTATAVKTDALSILGTTMTNLICTTLTLNSNASSVINGLQVLSNVVGSARTLTVGTLVTTGRIDFQDITGAGAATWTTASGATYFGDCGGNSGITFTTPAAQTWSGNTTGNASTAANWTSRVPLPQDNVLISGLTSGTVTFDMPRIGANIDFTGSTGGTFTVSVTITVYGDWKFVSGVTMSGTSNVTMSGRSNQMITSAGVTWTTAVIITASTGTYTFQDNFSNNRSSNPALQANIGTLNDGGKAVTLSGGSSAFSVNAAGNLTASGIWSLSGTGSVWTVNAGSVMTMTGSTILITDTSSTAKTFAGASKVYGTLSITAGGTGTVTLTGANTFAVLIIGGPKTVILPASTITNVTVLTASGTAGNLVTLQSSLGGTRFTLNSPYPGFVSLDYVSILDSLATGNTPFYAGDHSTNAGNNSGWTFGAGTQQLLTAGVSFSGAHVKQTKRLLTGVLSFAGSFAHLAMKNFTAALSFTGQKASAMTRSLLATLSFTGNHTKQTQRKHTAALSFTGSYVKTAIRKLTAGLSFTGAMSHLPTKLFTGALDFTGAMSRQTGRKLAANLSFTGTQNKTAFRAFVANLSFAGTVQKLTRRTLAGALSFTGALTKQTKRLFSAVLSSAGNLNAHRVVQRLFTASLGFTGKVTKQSRKNFVASLPLSGQISRRVTRPLTATLAFSGQVRRTTTKKLQSILSFVGNLNRSRIYHVALTAALSFAGSVKRQTTRKFAGVLSFAGNVTTLKPRLKALNATLGFNGSITQYVRHQFIDLILGPISSVKRLFLRDTKIRISGQTAYTTPEQQEIDVTEDQLTVSEGSRPAGTDNRFNLPS